MKTLAAIGGEIHGLLTHELSGLYRADALDRLSAWRMVYHKSGLPFARAAGDAPLLRELTRGGYLASVGGRTKASAHRLTWRGILATLPPIEPAPPRPDWKRNGGSSAADILNDLGILAGMETDCLNGGLQAIPGYRLAPSAIAMTRGKGDPEVYRRELAYCRIALWPILAMGWARVYMDRGASIWAVEITDSGRDAVSDPPDQSLPVGEAFSFDSWQAGFDYSEIYATRTPPSWTHAFVPWRLSTGAAWGGVDKLTPARAYREQKGFAGITAKQDLPGSTKRPGNKQCRKRSGEK